MTGLRNSLSRWSVAGIAAFLLAGGAAAQTVSVTEKGATARLPVRGAALTVKVAEFDSARQKLIDAAQAEGAEVVDMQTRRTEKGRKHGWVRLRLDAEHLQTLLPQIRAIGTLYGENLTTDERASEYEDLAKRVNRLHEHQGRLDGLLNSERRLRGSDILYVQERLFRASVDEDMLRQQQLNIERRSQVASVVVELFEPLPVRTIDRARIDFANWFTVSQGNARYKFQRTLAKGMTGAAYALVYSPIWLPCLIVVLLLLRAAWRFLKEKQVFAALRAFGIALGSVLVSLATFIAESWAKWRSKTAVSPSPPAPLPILGEGSLSVRQPPQNQEH